MSARIDTLLKDGEAVYPVTKMEAVTDETGKTLPVKLNELEEEVADLSESLTRFAKNQIKTIDVTYSGVNVNANSYVRLGEMPIANNKFVSGTMVGLSSNGSNSPKSLLFEDGYVYLYSSTQMTSGNVVIRFAYFGE